ncbi:MAG TPA: aldehyde dehydrogenase family protein, partial [Ktedonobacteraceae bacterium]|nr:aldehyde dehydrogenase family protein [Ktedonobacteraceae bacterium]
MAKVFESVTSRAQTPFTNEPLTDFTHDKNKQAQLQALAQVKSELGRTYPLVIGGKHISSEETFASLNPAQPEQVVGYFARATVEQTNQAVQAAAQAFETWRRVPAEERAGYLFRAADLLRERRFLMNAWMIYEVGKSWVEADADTAEAIDFMDFYAHEMMRLAGEQPVTQVVGEDNRLVYIPLGVGAVIPPWNFPCAIMVG